METNMKISCWEENKETLKNILIGFSIFGAIIAITYIVRDLTNANDTDPIWGSSIDSVSVDTLYNDSIIYDTIYVD